MNAKTKICDEWRKLNLKIAYHQKVIKQNTKESKLATKIS
jgi:hypothetical protein